MITSRIKTANGSRYLQQLCKHWSHRLEVSFTPEAGDVAMPMGRLTLKAEADRLDIALYPDDGADIERMKSVVADHLDRFAFREAPLAFNWQTDA